jgi:Flp pilus assembly pilin Flp
MNLYSLIIVIVAVVILANITGMTEPFNLIKDATISIGKDLSKNDVLFNTVVLVTLIAVILKAVHMLSGRNKHVEDKKGPDRLGDRDISGRFDGRA